MQAMPNYKGAHLACATVADSILLCALIAGAWRGLLP
jgi:hypothetical protein